MMHLIYTSQDYLQRHTERCLRPWLKTRCAQGLGGPRRQCERVAANLMPSAAYLKIERSLAQQRREAESPPELLSIAPNESCANLRI